MRTIQLSVSVLVLLLVLVTFSGCDFGTLSDPEYPLPQSGVYKSIPLDHPNIVDVDTSPDGDVFVYACFDSLAMNPLPFYSLYRISPYGETLFQSMFSRPPGSWIEVTADFGCVSHGLINSTKVNSNGDIDWEIAGAGSAVVPRPDGSVILAGPASEEDSLFHVAAVNQLGMTLWETTFSRDPDIYFNKGCITPDGTIALVEILVHHGFIIPEWPAVAVGGIYLVAEDGSNHSYLPAYSYYRGYSLDFAALQNGGFIMAGVGRDDYLTHIIEWNSAGNAVWDYTLPDDQEEFVAFELTNEDGLVVLTSRSDLDKMKLRRFDTNHNLLWTREYGDVEQPMTGLDVAVLADGRIQIAGLTHLGEVIIYREEDLIVQ